jgi:hypothetical protein
MRHPLRVGRTLIVAALRLPIPAMDKLLDLLQWPAMLATIVASYWVAATHPRKRIVGFWTFLVSNVLWAVWGWQTQAVALVVLQFCLAAMNIRGFVKASGASHRDGAASAGS